MGSDGSDRGVLQVAAIFAFTLLEAHFIPGSLHYIISMTGTHVFSSLIQTCNIFLKPFFIERQERIRAISSFQINPECLCTANLASNMYPLACRVLTKTYIHTFSGLNDKYDCSFSKLCLNYQCLAFFSNLYAFFCVL